MAKKKRRARQALQFSKRTSIVVTGFWIIFRLVEIVAAIVQPSISDALVKLVSGVDGVMMVNLGFYCGNSVAEKAILAWMDSRGPQGDEEEAANIEYAIKHETTLEQAKELTQTEEEPNEEEEEATDNG